jgi:hypothetical protein
MFLQQQQQLVVAGYNTTATTHQWAAATNAFQQFDQLLQQNNNNNVHGASTSAAKVEHCENSENKVVLGSEVQSPLPKRQNIEDIVKNEDMVCFCQFCNKKS